MRGAWIEIMHNACYITHFQSLPVRGAWIEIYLNKEREQHAASLPVRGAWIEIRHYLINRKEDEVAPRAGSVD